MEIVHRLQQSTGTCTCDSTGIGTGDGTGICIGSSPGTSTVSGTTTSVGAQELDYFLTVEGLVRFQDRIYVPDNSELKKVILREFHTKHYSSHPIYQNTLRVVKIYYYWPNLKRDVVEFVARCFDE